MLTPLDKILMESMDHEDMLDIIDDELVDDIDESFDFETASTKDELNTLFPV